MSIAPFRRAALATVACLLLASLIAPATSAEGQTIHTVQPGENLFRIGLRYGVSWAEIMQANGLSDTYIYAGQQLVIPVAGAPAMSDPAPVRPAPFAGTYTVSRGDTLMNLAARFGTTAYALAAANGIPNMNFIYAGQQLIIPGSAPTPGASAQAAPGGGNRIVVDISDQRLYAFQDGALLYNFIASTGMPGLDTWPGTYSVLNKIPNAYGGNWNIWMPNWLGIYWAGNLQNGIHALPILPNGGRLWDGYLGTPVSYGCVILGIYDSQLLYDWATVGTLVAIQY